MTRTKLLVLGAVALGMTSGCEVLVPLAIATSGAGSAPIEDYGDYDYDYEETPLDVTLVEATGRVGDLELAGTPLVASGVLYGTSTNLHVRVDPGEVELDEERPLEIVVDLCPIEDVLLNGADTTAFLSVYACRQQDCLDGTYDMRARVVEDELGVRTITVDTTLEGGEPLHVVLQYTSPL